MDGPGQNFNKDYYSVPAFWQDRRLLLPDALKLTEPVTAIRIDVAYAHHTLVLSCQKAPEAAWQKLIELKPVNEELMLFILLATRKFLRESARKKGWKLSGRCASQRTIDVVLQSLVLPTWGLPSSGTGRNEYVLNKISEIVGELRRRIGTPIEGGFISDASQSADRELDELVFALYEFDNEEQNLAKATTAAQAR